jgi:O-antigen polysaccharide polymerase Wzy
MVSSLITNKEVTEKLNISLILSILTTLALYLFSSYLTYSILGIGISIYIALRLIVLMDYTIPIIEIMLFIAALQWIIGPIIDYNNTSTHYKMYMYVDELTYMEITIPLFFSFMITSISIFKHNILNIDNLKEYLSLNKMLPFYILAISFVAKLLTPFIPPSLAFITFLTSITSIVGLGAIYFTRFALKIKIITTTIVILLSLYEAIIGGLFHNFIIISLLIFIIININIKLSLIKKITLIILSIALLSILQLIKGDYREIIYDKSFKGNKIELFLDLILNNEKIETLNEDDEQNNVNTRLNQGWIISKIYERIPEKKDFFHGETIIDAINIALVPRFLSPNKRGGGGKYTFEKLTGFTLLKGTAMGVSLLGEFYANFGVLGAFISFFIWGLILKLIVAYIYNLQKLYPIIILFLPVIFFQVIKAETDLTTVLNHLVKSLIFVFLFISFIKKTSNTKIISD